MAGRIAVIGKSDGGGQMYVSFLSRLKQEQTARLVCKLHWRLL